MNILTYQENSNFIINVNEHNFITIMGKGNKRIIDYLKVGDNNNYISLFGNKVNHKNINEYRCNVSFVLNEQIDIFTSETVEDELAYALENMGIKKSLMHEKVMECSVKFGLEDIFNKDPKMIGSSKQALIKIVQSLIVKPKIIILDEVLSLLDRKDKEKVISYLIEFVKEGNSIINFTSDIEDSLYGNYIILTDNDKLIAYGRTISILKEEKLMKRYGFSLPFIFDLNKQLMYYDLLDKYVLDSEGLVDLIWK